MNELSVFKRYNELLLSIDCLSSSIQDFHSTFITCKKGCSNCCLADIHLFPLEAVYIKHNIKSQNISPPSHIPENNCIFLSNDLCSIYNLRPVLCRTQGLPLIYQCEEDSNEYELSICDLNFVDFDFNTIEDEHVINMEEINNQLALLNLQFLKEIDKFEALKYTRFSMNDIILKEKLF